MSSIVSQTCLYPRDPSPLPNTDDRGTGTPDELKSAVFDLPSDFSSLPPAKSSRGGANSNKRVLVNRNASTRSHRPLAPVRQQANGNKENTIPPPPSRLSVAGPSLAKAAVNPSVDVRPVYSVESSGFSNEQMNTILASFERQSIELGMLRQQLAQLSLAVQPKPAASVQSASAQTDHVTRIRNVGVQLSSACLHCGLQPFDVEKVEEEPGTTSSSAQSKETSSATSSTTTTTESQDAGMASTFVDELAQRYMSPRELKQVAQPLAVQTQKKRSPVNVQVKKKVSVKSPKKSEKKKQSVSRSRRTSSGSCLPRRRSSKEKGETAATKLDKKCLLYSASYSQVRLSYNNDSGTVYETQQHRRAYRGSAPGHHNQGRVRGPTQDVATPSRRFDASTLVQQPASSASSGSISNDEEDSSLFSEDEACRRSISHSDTSDNMFSDHE